MTIRPHNLLTSLNRLTPAVLSLFRVVIGLLFVFHGTSKLFGWPTGPIATVGSWPLFYAGVIEVVCGLLVTVGLFTRIAAFIASGEMAVGFFVVHLPNGLMPLTNGGEMAVVYCFALFLLFFTGGGAYALDRRLLLTPAQACQRRQKVDHGSQLSRFAPSPVGTYHRVAHRLRGDAIVR